MASPSGKTVREFRHILLWPLQLRRLRRETGLRQPLGRAARPSRPLAGGEGQPAGGGRVLPDGLPGLRLLPALRAALPLRLRGGRRADALEPAHVPARRHRDRPRPDARDRRTHRPRGGAHAARVLLRPGRHPPRPRGRGARPAARGRDRADGPLRAALSPVLGRAGAGRALHLPGGIPRHGGASPVGLGLRRPRQVRGPGARHQADAAVAALGIPAASDGARVSRRRDPAVLPDREQAHPDHDLPRAGRAARASRAGTSRASATRPNGARRTRCPSRRASSQTSRRSTATTATGTRTTPRTG